MAQTFMTTGLPLLSGDISLDDGSRDQDRSQQSCRRCDKEFNFLLARSRQCNHCGYLYCSSCSDYQALIPRIENNVVRGYEPTNICAFCNDMLTITASSKAQLSKLSVSKLRDYMLAYNIKLPNGVIEKEELVNSIISARGSNGCLSKENERYYRRHSLPDRRTNRQSTASRARNFWNRATGSNGTSPSSPTSPPQPNTSTRPSQNAPRPSRPPQQQHYDPRPPTTNPNTRPHASHVPPSDPPPRQQQYNAPPRPPPHQTRPYPPQPPRQQQRPSPPPRPNTVPPRSPPREPPPTLEALLALSAEEIMKLSIHDLKGVLFANHVNARLVVEKSELVEKVKMLVEQEREERETARLRQEQEEREERERAQRADEERIRLQHQMMEEHLKRQEAQAHADADASTAMDVDTPDLENKPKPLPNPTKPISSYAAAERNGLCVICQDEDANIAIVDCGHLCLCRGCSQTVMNSTRECPMCRTRIVTEARLLRIFKT